MRAITNDFLKSVNRESVIERERGRDNVRELNRKRKRKGKKPQTREREREREEETWRDRAKNFSLMRFDSAASSFLALFVIKSLETELKNAKTKRKFSRFFCEKNCLKQVFCL